MNVTGDAEERGGGKEGGGDDGSRAVKAVVGAITETVMVGSTTYYPAAKSLPGALCVAYTALFLTIRLFLAILLVLVLLLLLPRPSDSGGGGGGAVKFAEHAALAVVFLVPLIALTAKVYAVLNSKANVPNK